MAYPAAASVITADDIRRSGATSLPEVLRISPGVEVARVDTSHYSIGIRGFGEQFSKSVLVLIDGRNLYNQLFAGTYWPAHDIPLEDIERIEIIRGPGGTVWGGNAVNGVINVITKPAGDTRGLLASVTTGSSDHGIGGAAFRRRQRRRARLSRLRPGIAARSAVSFRRRQLGRRPVGDAGGLPRRPRQHRHRRVDAAGGHRHGRARPARPPDDVFAAVEPHHRRFGVDVRRQPAGPLGAAAVGHRCTASGLVHADGVAGAALRGGARHHRRRLPAERAPAGAQPADLGIRVSLE